MRGKILVVDDEPGPRESLRMILKDKHDVRTATNGYEALEEIERDKPDMVFLDLRMPGMDGTEVMRVIKERHPEVEVAIITAYAAVESARLAVQLGAIDYVIKPYSVADVEGIAARAIRSRREEHDAQVLGAQLEKMTVSLAGQSDALAKLDDADVSEAINSLKCFQEGLGDDLASVQELYELGEMTAEVSHDVNNLLTVILTSAQVLLEHTQDEQETDASDVHHWVSTIVTAAEDCTSILQQIRNYVRTNVNQTPQPVAVNDLISMAAELTRDTAHSRASGEVEFVLRLKTVPPVEGDEVALRNVLVNLIENGLDALRGGGCLQLCSECDDEWVRIKVQDDGIGMPPDVVKSATEAFFSTKESHGTGLGLSIAEKVMGRHGGKLTIESQQGQGTTVALWLPIEPVSKEERAPERPATRPRGHRHGTIIVIDDQDAMRDIMVRVLQAEGYDVLFCSDADQGWELFEETLRHKNGDGPMMVVTDHEMPGTLGRELAAKIKQVDKKIPVVIVTGYSISEEGPEDALVAKPFAVREFIGPINELMDRLAEEHKASTATKTQPN